jgi:hypothetical protein
MNWQRLAFIIPILWIVGLERVCARHLPQDSPLAPRGATQSEDSGTPLAGKERASAPVKEAIPQLPPAQPNSVPEASANDDKNGLVSKAEVVCRLDFEQDKWDRNFDQWPDEWVRKTGSGFPAYVDIGIRPFPSDKERWGEGSLHVKLDGGAAEISSPPIPINPNYSYMLDGWTFLSPSDRKEINETWISITLLSDDDENKQTFTTQRVRDQEAWKQLKLGPIVPADPKFNRLMVTLHLHPTRPTDLFGEAWFDNLRLTHLPKLNATTSHPFNIFEKPEDVEILVSVSGTRDEAARLQFTIFDVEGRLVDEHTIDHHPPSQANDSGKGITTLPAAFASKTIADNLSEDGKQSIRRKRGPGERYVWTPKIDSEGFYRVLVTLTGADQPDLARDISLVIMPPMERVNTSPFGWSIHRQPESIPLQNLVELLRQSGVHWLAYPVWFAKDDLLQAQRIGELAERLTLNGMDLVAVLDQPPEELRGDFNRYDQGIASVLHDADLWQPALDPVLTRLSFKIDWWQLGGFDDLSFVSHPNVELKVSEVREHLSRFGKNIKLGIAWNWLHEKQLESTSSLDYLLRTTPTKMTGHELLTYLRDQQDSKDPIWTTIQPLDRQHYSLVTRVRDLIERMIMGKISGASAVFIPEPISSEQGVLNEDLSPTELLLPWRMTARSLAGAQYLGQLDLPNGSENYLFRRTDDVVMVIWKDHPLSEPVNLGVNIQTLDCWGRPSNSFHPGQQDILDVGPIPQFVSGLDPHLVEWQMNCHFTRQHIDSVIGRSQATRLEFKNTLDFGVSGIAKLTSNQLWEKPLEIPFKINPGETFSAPLDLVLRSNVSSGRHDIRIDFDLAGHHRQQMTVYRYLNIGIPGIKIDSATQIKEEKLLLHVTVINESSEEANFNLYLFAPNRRRQRMQIAKMKPGRARRTFIVPNGDQLQGENIWLRVEEVKGNRILNYQIPVENQLSHL